MNITEQKERNEIARNQVERMNKELGIMLKHVSKRLDMNQCSLSQWRSGMYELGKERLDKVTQLAYSYNIE